MVKQEKASSNNVAGIQLALFEIIWPTFQWIDRIYMKSDPSACIICIQSASKPSDEDWDDCCRLINEILDMAFDGQAVQQRIVWEQDKPESDDYLKIMSPSIFEEIAREVDPSRLDAGR